MPSVKYLYHILLLYGILPSIWTIEPRPLVFVLCLKGFRWDLLYSHSHLPNFHRLTTTGSRALWVESEFGGSQTNILSFMSGLHVEHHARRDFIETIPVLNEHVGGHTRLLYWPWFDRQQNQSKYSHLRNGRKGQPEVIETYSNNGRMSSQRLTRHLTSMLDSLIDENDRTNLIMSFIDEPYTTLVRHGIHSDGLHRTMLNLDRLLGRLLSITSQNNINLIVFGDHGIEPIECRQPIYIYHILNQQQLKTHTDRYSGTSFSFVFYPKTDYTSQILLHQLQRESSKQMEIYSNDQNNLPPKLRLPLTPGKPSPIVVLAREGFYFSYDTEPNPIHCDRNRPNCPKSTLADHSDDPRHLSMRTAFLAHGPMFKKGHINEPILITDVYALLRQILCLSPFPATKGGLFNIHQMFNLTTLSNTCAYRYLASVNMIQSVSLQPTKRMKTVDDDNAKLVYVNIAERRQKLHQNLIKMDVTIE